MFDLQIKTPTNLDDADFSKSLYVLKKGELFGIPGKHENNGNEMITGCRLYIGNGETPVKGLRYIGRDIDDGIITDSTITGGTLSNATLNNVTINGSTISGCNIPTGSTLTNAGTISGGTILATMSDKLTNYTATDTNQLQGYINPDKSVYTVYISLKDVPSDASIILITGYWSPYISTSISPFMLMCIRTWSGWECSPIKLGEYPPLEFTFTDMNDTIIPGYPNDTPRLELDVAKESYMLISYSRVAINVLI